VVWSYNDAYCGWAPLPPGAVYSDTLGLIYGGAAVDMGFDFGLSPDSFVFVSLNYFGNPHPFQHRLNRDQARQVYRQTPIINQFERRGQGFVNRGIDPASIVRVTHTTIQPVMLQAASRVNGRFTPGGPAARAGAAVAPNRPQAPGGPSAANLRNDPAVMNNPQTATVTREQWAGPGAFRPHCVRAEQPQRASSEPAYGAAGGGKSPVLSGTGTAPGTAAPGHAAAGKSAGGAAVSG
jgi:hypothetical protein